MSSLYQKRQRFVQSFEQTMLHTLFARVVFLIWHEGQFAYEGMWFYSSRQQRLIHLVTSAPSDVTFLGVINLLLPSRDSSLVWVSYLQIKTKISHFRLSTIILAILILSQNFIFCEHPRFLWRQRSKAPHRDHFVCRPFVNPSGCNTKCFYYRMLYLNKYYSFWLLGANFATSG